MERNQKLRLKRELKQYWKDILLLLQRPPDGSTLHNVARKDYEVKNLIVPENLEDPEQKVSATFILYPLLKYYFVDSGEI